MTKDELDTMIQEVIDDISGPTGTYFVQTKRALNALRDKILNAKCASKSPSGFSCDLAPEHLQMLHEHKFEGESTVSWNH
jgi:hypothetical protein